MLIDTAGLDRESIRRKGFAEFVKRAWSQVEPSVPLIWNWHLDEMCRHAEAVTVPRRVTNADAIGLAHPELIGQWHPPIIRDLVVNIPPSHSKTVIWCILWPAWVWTWRPDYRWMFASYEDSVSLDAAKKSYALLSSAWFAARWGNVLKKSAHHAVGDFYSSSGGRRFTTSVGGRATGVHCHCFVTDDPVKAEAGRSIGSDLAAQLVKANDWHRDTVTSRAVDPATFCKVVIMQRLHELDLSQQCIDQGYEHLCLPALYDPDQPCRTSVGGDKRASKDELLFPARFPRAELDKWARAMFGWEGPVASAQLQQRPAPKGGLIFRLDSFKRFSLANMPISRTVSVLSIDCNFKKADVNSDVGITVSGFRAPNMHIYEALSLNIGFIETIKVTKALLSKWRTTAVLIEDKALGPGLIEILRVNGLNNIVAVEPLDSKEARAHGANTYYQAGSVYHCDEMSCTGLGKDPSASAGVDAFEKALNVFPRGRKRDVIDAHTQAVWYMATQNYSKLLGALNALHDETPNGFDAMFRIR
jgi:phage terminase large subunit-like protein